MTQQAPPAPDVAAILQRLAYLEAALAHLIAKNPKAAAHALEWAKAQRPQRPRPAIT